MLHRVSYTAREFTSICRIGNAPYPIDQLHDVEGRGDGHRFVGHAVAAIPSVQAAAGRLLRSEPSRVRWMRRVVVGADLLCQDYQSDNGPEPSPSPVAGRVSSEDRLAGRLQHLNFTMGVAAALVPLDFNQQPPHEHLWLGQTIGEVFEKIGARIAHCHNRFSIMPTSMIPLFSSPAFG